MENKQDQIKSSDYLYLEKLEFNPALRKGWLNFFVSNFRVVVLLMILISGWGVYSFTRLPRESQPEVKIPIAVVVTPYPGVSPSDIEELVTKRIETGISGIKGIKKITSNSANSLSSITVEFDASEDLEDSIRRLRDEVGSLKAELPEEAGDPVVREISFNDQPIWSIALTGPYDGFTLRKYANDLKDELEKINGVREVGVSGGDEREFEIAYDPQKLITYGITPDQANQAVKAHNIAVPAGIYEGSGFNYPVRADARIFDVKKLENTPIFHTDDGAIVYLKDLAKVSERAIRKTAYSRISIKGGKAEPAVSIDIVKKTGGSILKVVDESRATADRMIKDFPEGMRYDITTDYAKFIRQDFNQLVHDFFLTISLVFIILFLVVGLKEALVAGMAVPLVFFVTFGVMQAYGITLNFLSMFSLILSLGLLVDDAIVVVSATKQYLKTGKYTPEEAVLLVLNDFKVVLTTTTLATVWAFLPLLSSTGIIGEFIKSIPITVSTTLIASLLVALMINHPLAAVLERVRFTRNIFLIIIFGLFMSAALLISFKSVWSYLASAACAFAVVYLIRWYRNAGSRILAKNKELMELEWEDDALIKKKLAEQGSVKDKSIFGKLFHGVVNLNRLLPLYEKYLCKLICTRKRRIYTLAATAALFIFAVMLPVAGIVPTEFFPVSDQGIMYVNLRAPTGINLDATDGLIRQVEEKLLSYKEISNFSTRTGGGSSQQLSSGSNSSNLASIVINLVEEKERKAKSYELAEIIRNDLESIKGAEITVETPAGGPPSGSAFEARIIGDDLDKLDSIANDLKPILTGIPGVINADISLKQSPAEYTFTLDSSRMELYSLNAAYVGSMLRMAISGAEVTKIIREGEETEVVARFSEETLPSLESLQNLQILNLKKQPVFIKDVAKIELKPSVESITRIDQKRVVLLSAGVSGKTRPNQVLSEFQKRLSGNYDLPQGYTVIYGGENEQNTESVFSIIRAMVVAMVLIVSTLVIQFNSFKKAMIVLVTIPLALIGVFIGMAIARVTLSFPGLIGILALFGIVVKNAIILVDKINLNLKFKIPFYEAVVDAGKSRLEAIFITSICTIVGIIPVTLSNETWLALGSVVIFGLLLSSFFTLFIVPTLFMTLIHPKERF